MTSTESHTLKMRKGAIRQKSLLASDTAKPRTAQGGVAASRAGPRLFLVTPLCMALTKLAAFKTQAMGQRKVLDIVTLH